jgi:hypothetical protein
MKELKKKLWKNVEIGKETVPVYFIDGNYVRVEYYVDFKFGGHNMATSHKFIPKGEIWIEQILKGVDRDAILVHEAHEYNLMKNKKMSYVKAHKLSNLKEARFRKAKMDEFIEKLKK